MFLALPEIIPPRKRKRQQPLLDFTKFKILTSRAYSEGCERVMAQREAPQTEAKRKAVEREANKETRRKEKEEWAEQVRIRKEDRAAKKVQREQAEEECQACRGNKWVGIGAGAGGEGAVTRREGAVAGKVAEAGAEGVCDLVETASAYWPSAWTSASPPHDTDHVVAMVRPLSPPRMM